MKEFWDNWLEAVRFTCEAQNVMSARLMLLATGAPDDVVEETAQMVSEKFVAFAKAALAAETAFEDGQDFAVAAERAYLPVRECVQANLRRLRSTMR